MRGGQGGRSLPLPSPYSPPPPTPLSPPSSWSGTCKFSSFPFPPLFPFFSPLSLPPSSYPVHPLNRVCEVLIPLVTTKSNYSKSLTNISLINRATLTLISETVSVTLAPTGGITPALEVAICHIFCVRANSADLALCTYKEIYVNIEI